MKAGEVRMVEGGTVEAEARARDKKAEEELRWEMDAGRVPEEAGELRRVQGEKETLVTKLDWEF